jgi:molecular chaperone DnaK
LLYSEVRASQVYGQLVQTIVEMAAQTLGQRVDELVITVPASAEDRLRVQAHAAVEMQGLRVRRLINQPAAALLTAQLAPSVQHVAVVNCGGGSTEVSLAERSGDTLRILSTSGDLALGGEDMIWTVAEGINKRFRHTVGVDVFATSDSCLAAMGLRAAAEEAVQNLCFAPEAMLVLDHGGGFGRDLVTIVRRPDIDRWLTPLMERVSALCDRALSASGLKTHQVNSVLLIGDWAHLPTLQENIAYAFRRPVAALHTTDAALLPVYGAALAATDEAHFVWDVTPYALGINCYYGDVELFSPIIWANTPIPTPDVGATGAFTEPYQTRFPDQTSVTLDVLQYRGPRVPDPYNEDRVTPEECELLGSWKFDGLRPDKGRHAKFTATFAVDADGILHLHARETATGNNLRAQVKRGIG